MHNRPTRLARRSSKAKQSNGLQAGGRKESLFRLRVPAGDGTKDSAGRLERYVAVMNGNNRNPLVWRKLRNELSEKAEAMYGAYLKERADQGFPPEVGRAFC